MRTLMALFLTSCIVEVSSSAESIQALEGLAIEAKQFYPELKGFYTMPPFERPPRLPRPPLTPWRPSIPGTGLATERLPLVLGATESASIVLSRLAGELR